MLSMSVAVIAITGDVLSEYWPPVEEADIVRTGPSLTGFTVIVTVCGAEVSTPPFAVPPSSWIFTVTVATPLAFGAGVKVRVPVDETAGWLLNRPLLLLLTMKSSVWPLSLPGPLPRVVAHPETVWAAASSFTVWSAPLVKLGTSLTGLTVIITIAALAESRAPSLDL